MLFVGIDPGQTGGIAVLNEKRELVKYWNMPFDSNTGLIGITWMSELLVLERFRPQSGLKVWIERNHGMPGNNWASMFKFGYATGQIVGMLSGRGIPIHFVSSLQWRDSILTKSARKMGKQPAKDHVLKMYNLAVPHDGISDAICIAEFGWKADKGQTQC